METLYFYCTVVHQIFQKVITYKIQNLSEPDYLLTTLILVRTVCKQINKCFMGKIIKYNFCSWLLVPSSHMYKEITTTISTIFFVIPIPIYCHHHHHQIVKELSHLFTNCSLSSFSFHTHILAPICYNQPISAVKFCLIQVQFSINITIFYLLRLIKNKI